MVIHKFKSNEHKGRQQWAIVINCEYYWGDKNNTDISYYHDLMNMKTNRYNYDHYCPVALTYHFNLNKW